MAKQKKPLPFKPAWWLPGAHLQTLWPALCRPTKKLSCRSERFELADGDFVDLVWVGAESGPIVLLLHGLEGSVRSGYAQGMLRVIAQCGWRGVFMHFRSCSDVLNRLAQTYHSGDTKDVDALLAAIHAREPHTPLAAVGVSLGGNVLLKWLGETGKANPLQAAVAISVPFELQKAVDHLQQGFARIYQKHFLRSLCKKIHTKFKTQAAPIDLLPLNNIKTLREFDNKVTAPLHGFLDADDYYKQSSSRQYLSRIEVPTLLLQAKDDPFMPVDSLPTPQELSAQVRLELSEKGGHVGFVAGHAPWQAEYWLEQRVLTYLAPYLSPNELYEKA